MRLINHNDLNRILRGSSLLACGGGLSFTEQTTLLQKKIIKEALHNRVIQLVTPEELADDACCATISEVGASDAPVMDKSLLPRAKSLFEQKTGQKITAIIPAEIGQESIVLEAAIILNLPIVDTDFAGCRAVPRLTDMALVVRGIPFTMSPMVILNDEGKITFIDRQSSLADDEKKVRASVKHKKVVTMLGGMVFGKIVKQFLTYNSYSLANNLGKALIQKESLSEILPTKCLLPPTLAKVVKVKKIDDDGFDQKVALLQTKKGEVFELKIKNEYMQLKQQQLTFNFPQLIMVFSPEKKRGLHSSEIEIGEEVILLVAEMFDFWKEKKYESNTKI